MIDVKADIARIPAWKNNDKKNEIAQMPCTWSTLTKKFYLKRYSRKIEVNDELHPNDEIPPRREPAPVINVPLQTRHEQYPTIEEVD